MEQIKSECKSEIKGKSKINDKLIGPRFKLAQKSSILPNWFSISKLSLTLMTKAFGLVLVFTSLRALAERGVNVDVNGFMESSTEMALGIGNKTVIIAVIATAIGLMVPGFRELTRRSLPWIMLGILLIVLVTKFWR